MPSLGDSGRFDRSEPRLAAAARKAALALLHGTVSRRRALKRLSRDVPGWSRSEHGAALDEAIERTTPEFQREIADRAAVIAAAQEEGLLDGCLRVMAFNDAQWADPRMEPSDAFRGMWSRADIGEAQARAQRLIKDGWTVGYGPIDPDGQRRYIGLGREWTSLDEIVAALRRRHPGFSDRSIGTAIDRGFFLNR